MFETFGKLEDLNNLNPNGIGMSLYLCKKIVSKLSGSIKVESILDSGSTFELNFSNNEVLNLLAPPNFNASRRQSSINFSPPNNIITLNIPEEEIKELNNNSTNLIEPVQTVRMEISECNCPKLLIVDDEFTNRFVLSQFCLKCFIRYDEAKNGQEALNKVKYLFENNHCCRTFKIILMDSNMPIMNGEQSSIEIRSYLKKSNVNPPKIICITANSNVPQIVKETNDLIYDRLIFKPLSLEKFQNEIGYIL